MIVTVRLPGVLRGDTGGAAAVAVDVADGATVVAVLDALDAVHPRAGWRIRDEQGLPRRHVNVFVGERNIRDLAGLDTPAAAGGEVTILPAVSGGA